MHLRSVEIRNIRSIGTLTWNVDAHVSDQDLGGWHVILGDNGSGKSSMLRAIALALNGPTEARALREDWASWLRHGTAQGGVSLVLEPHEQWDFYSGSGRLPVNHFPSVEVEMLRDESDKSEVTIRSITGATDPRRNVWGGSSGWFSASYGPFRRFSGGDKDTEKIFHTNPRLARHLTTFGESVALSEATAWLHELKFEALEAERAGPADGGPSGRLLVRLLKFVNESGFLPHGTRIEDVTSKEVLFRDGDGNPIPVNDLSDGYRSMLSLAFELLRSLVREFGNDHVFDAETTHVVVPGVVLVDEIDAHLHPRWQRRVGQWFLERFPRMQFIVTTHSPLVCQAAERGTIYRLPRPGSGDTGRFATGKERDRLLYGNVLDAYETESFDEVLTRSDSGREKLERLAELNVKARRSPLTADEDDEREHLRAVLPTLGPGEGRA